MRKFALLLISILLLSALPLKSQELTDCIFMNYMDSDSHPYTFEKLQKSAPQGYVCGYVVKDTWGESLYSMFLYKDRRRYKLILNAGGISKERKISRKLASRLEESVINRFAYEANDIIIDDNVDYYKIYAMLPARIAEYWSHVSMQIPDKLWREEYLIMLATLQ